MLWDAGLPLRAMDNITAVQAKVKSIIMPPNDNALNLEDDHHHHNPDLSKIEEMEETFDLVMVAERWDESMVLLKQLLCWEFRSPLI